MSDSYAVATTALTGHASNVANLADELRSALAAAQVTLADNAYGQTCQQVSAILNAVAQAGQGTVQAGVATLDSFAALLRATADTYAEQEATQAGVLTAITGDGAMA